jgi:hypothetical protein
VQAAHVYLLEDGLLLWISLLQAAVQPTDALLSLFPRAVQLLEGGSESVRDVMRVLDLYLALYPQVIDVCGALLCLQLSFMKPAC